MAACSIAVAGFLLARLTAWPPHEDETLALFVGRESLPDLLETVQRERGGAPLHFLFAWLVAHLGGGLGALRLFSALFAVASVPVIAALCARLAGRAAALVATALVSASWMLLFHGIYGRMYSLFLLTSTLSYLAFLVAVEHGGRRRWALWVVAILAVVATHPYGALVLASQCLYVLARARTREAIGALVAVAVLGIPFWYSDLILAGRFDVGVGAGGERLRRPARDPRVPRTRRRGLHGRVHPGSDLRARPRRGRGPAAVAAEQACGHADRPRRPRPDRSPC